MKPRNKLLDSQWHRSSFPSSCFLLYRLSCYNLKVQHDTHREHERSSYGEKADASQRDVVSGDLREESLDLRTHVFTHQNVFSLWGKVSKTWGSLSWFYATSRSLSAERRRDGAAKNDFRELLRHIFCLLGG